MGLGKILNTGEKIKYESIDEFGNKTEVEGEFMGISEHKSQATKINLVAGA